jgi:hypothetical protein
MRAIRWKRKKRKCSLPVVGWREEKKGGEMEGGGYCRKAKWNRRENDATVMALCAFFKL